jgi:TonB family protein
VGSSQPLEQTVYVADLIYVGTVKSVLADRRVQFLLVKAIKGDVEAAPTLAGGGGRLVQGHTYVVFASAVGATGSGGPVSYSALPCGPAPAEIVRGDQTFINRVREIAREQSRTTERPRVGHYPAKKIREVAPVWPGQARAAQNSRTIAVILEVTINAAGAVSEVRVARSFPPFDQAAIDAIRQWEYLPALDDGIAVPTHTTEAVVFKHP